MNVISEIVKFQTDRELDKKPYSAINEHTNIVEELFESVGLDIPKGFRDELSAAISEMSLEMDCIINPTETQEEKAEKLKLLSDNDRCDAYCDVIVFAIGALLKLGYDPEKALAETAKEINSRQGEMINGKFEKFLSPAMQSLWHKANYDTCKR